MTKFWKVWRYLKKKKNLKDSRAKNFLFIHWSYQNPCTSKSGWQADDTNYITFYFLKVVSDELDELLCWVLLLYQNRWSENWSVRHEMARIQYLLCVAITLSLPFSEAQVSNIELIKCTLPFYKIDLSLSTIFCSVFGLFLWISSRSPIYG